MTYSIISRHRSVLMGVAALWIYVFHMMPPGLLEAYPGWWQSVWFLRAAGFCGVDMFLFLSGFGLYYHFSRHPINSLQDCLTFYKQRFSKIYQVFLPFTLIFAVYNNWTIRDLIRRLFAYNQLTSYVYDFCWYVVCILVFYLLVPGFMYLYRKAGKWGGAATVAVCCGYIFGIWYFRDHLRWDLFAIYNRLPVFLLGIPAGELAKKERKIGLFGWIIGAGLLSVGAWLSFRLNSLTMDGIVPSTNALVNVLFAPGLILILSGFFERVQRLKPAEWGMQVIAFFGTVSFEFYLMQEWYVRCYSMPVTGMQQLMAFVLMTAFAWLLQKMSRFISERITIKL